MIKLNGHCERWFAGAGALGFDGFDGGHPPLVRLWKLPFRAARILDPRRFTVISKTVTLGPRQGRQTDWGFRKYAWPVSLKHRSMVNAVALTNPGIDAWVATYYKQAVRKGVRLVLSLHVEDVTEARVMGHLCRSLKHLSGIQINASCPNLTHGPVGVTRTPEEETAAFVAVVDAFQEACSLPLLVKFRLGQPWEEMARALDGRCAGYEFINAVPWDEAVRWHDGANNKAAVGDSPLQRYGYGGSLSGGKIAYASKLTLATYLKMGLQTPAITGGGVVSHPGLAGGTVRNPVRLDRAFVSLEQEVRDRLELGASAVAFSTAFLWEPWGPNRVAKKLDAELARVSRGRVAAHT